MPSLRVVGVLRNCAQNHRVLTLPDVIWQTYENAPRPDGQVLERERRTWKNTTIEFVETLKANMQVVRDLAYEKDFKEIESQKFYHDRKSVARNFDVGEYGLVVRPIRKSKLENQWQGPYNISKKLTEVTYQVDLGTFGKRYRNFHVNCIRKWTSPTPAAFMALDDNDLNHEKEGHTSCKPLTKWN